MKVKVVDGIQVTHDGASYRGGQTLEVPAEVARLWISSGWVTEAPATRRKGAAAK